MLLMLTTFRDRWRPHFARLTTARDGLYSWLDQRLFSWLIAYAASPSHIVLLLFIWLGLLLGGAYAAWELVGGNYTNGISAIGACILLYRQVRAERVAKVRHEEVMAHHHRHEERLDALHARVSVVEQHVAPNKHTPAPRSRKKAAE